MFTSPVIRNAELAKFQILMIHNGGRLCVRVRVIRGLNTFTVYGQLPPLKYCLSLIIITMSWS
jgi:hypothetical protein